MSVRARASRLPLRMRLVAGFVVAMTVVLSGAGVFLYWRVQFALDRRLDTDLAQEATTARPLVGADGAVHGDAADALDPGVRDHQVLDARGRVLSAGPGLGTEPLLGAEAVADALAGPVHRDTGALLPVSPRPLRLLAVPLGGPGPAAVLVVGVRRDERDEALRELLGQLLLVGVATLVVTAVVGERLAKAALAPVERYRARAQSIAAGATGVRLDVPPDREDEVTRLGDTLNDMLAALEGSLARERRFLDDASHELRTPLTLLRTRVQVTLRRPRSPQEHEAVLRELETDIADLAALAEQLLQLGATVAPGQPGAERPEGGPVPDEAARVAGGDVARVVDSVSATARDAAGAPTLLPPTWTVSTPPPGTTPVSAPDPALRQVLLNLLANAAVHGGPPVAVGVRQAVTTGATTGVVVLTVTDAGPGVPASFLPGAVERFARTDTARDRPGAGLGLSLVDALARRGGGELRLCSRGVHHRYEARFGVACDHPVEGTTASLLLPSTPTAAPRPGERVDRGPR